MKNLTIIIETETKRITSWYGFSRWTSSYSFSYNSNFIWNVASFNTILEANKFPDIETVFISNKNIWWLILLKKRYRDDIDILDSNTKWIIRHKWKFYITKNIEIIEKTNNWNWTFGSSTKWTKVYKIILKPIFLEELKEIPKTLRKSYKWEWFKLNYENWTYIKIITK